MSGHERICVLGAGLPENLVGGKARTLGKLLDQGYPVPRGIVIPDGELQRHLSLAGAVELQRSLIDALLRSDIEESQQLAKQIKTALLARELDSEVLHGLERQLSLTQIPLPLVVRSSAFGEDSKEHSFAGQLESYLQIDSISRLAQAILDCWASLFSERAIAYQHEKRFPLRHFGVLVQGQVRARVSGVLFTLSPSGGEEMLCEYVPGLCDSLVSGTITPGELRVSKESQEILRHRAFSTELDLLPLGGAFSKLFGLALRLERELGYPLDIEWSVDEDGVVWLLQARAITVFPKGSEEGGKAKVVWSNANIAENYFEPLTPLLYSIASTGYNQYFRNLGLGFGLSRSRISKMETHLESVVGVHCGRFYYNLSSIHALIRLAPFGRWLCRFFDEFVGAETTKPTAEETSSRNFLDSILEFLRVPFFVIGQYALVQKKVRRFERTIDSYCSQTHPEKLAKKTISELEGYFRQFLQIRFSRWNDAALADTATMICCGLLRRVLPKTVHGEPNLVLYTSLLTGVSDLKSSAPVSELWELSRRLRGNPELTRFFEEHSVEEIRREISRPEHAGFFKDFQSYLETWGFRTSGELLLSKPSPIEDPSGTLALLKQYALQDGPSPLEVVAVQHEAGQGVAASLGYLIRFLVFLTHGAIRLRERARFQQARLYVHLRFVLLTLGERLCAKGRLKQKEDIFFLRREELLSLLSGLLQFPEEIPADIDRRRAAYLGFFEQSPPSQLILAPGAIYEPVRRFEEGEEKPGIPSRTFHGLGACGGQVSGIARILQSASEGGELRPGEILVTSQTDPGWASVFPLIKGLVIERGGMLSHGAIVAREYGIPAVVGAPEVCKRIQNGMRIHVDGDRGTVEIDE